MLARDIEFIAGYKAACLWFCYALEIRVLKRKTLSAQRISGRIGNGGEHERNECFSLSP